MSSPDLRPEKNDSQYKLNTLPVIEEKNKTTTSTRSVFNKEMPADPPDLKGRVSVIGSIIKYIQSFAIVKFFMNIFNSQSSFQDASSFRNMDKEDYDTDEDEISALSPQELGQLNSEKAAAKNELEGFFKEIAKERAEDAYNNGEVSLDKIPDKTRLYLFIMIKDNMRMANDIDKINTPINFRDTVDKIKNDFRESLQKKYAAKKEQKDRVNKLTELQVSKMVKPSDAAKERVKSEMQEKYNRIAIQIDNNDITSEFIVYLNKL